MWKKPALTPKQIAKVIELWKGGATYPSISEATQIAPHRVGEAVKAWTSEHLAELQAELRAFIDGNLATGKRSMVLPRALRPTLAVLDEYRERYDITTKIALSVTWHHFHLRGKTRVLYPHINIGDVLGPKFGKSKKCCYCGLRDRKRGRAKCYECIDDFNRKRLAN